MNYYQPLELKGKDGTATGRYHYTITNDGHSRPVGYCAENCLGHDTKDGARAHWHAYCLDHARYDGVILNQQVPCEICTAWTQHYAEMGPGKMTRHHLCDAHCNRDGLAQVSTPGDSMGSY